MLIGIDASPVARARTTGTERYTLEIIRALLALPQAVRHQWRLYVPSPVDVATLLYDSTPVEIRTRMDVRVLPATRMWTHRRLGHEVFAHPPDVLYVPGRVLPVAVWPRRLPPSVVTLHDVAFRRYPETYASRQRLYLDFSYAYASRYASHMIAVSQATANDLLRFYSVDPGRMRVVHEAAAKPSVATREQIDAAKDKFHLVRPFALYLGTVQPRKNLVRLIHAHARLLSRGLWDLDLVIAGAPGWQAGKILAEPARLGVADRVHFTGYLSEVDRSALLGGAHFFCYPSLFEGFGLPILEAQGAGVPVLTANNSSLPEVAGDAAILVDPLDVEALADAMLRLSQDEALRQRLIAAGHENVKRFSWEKAARETLAVLEAAAATRNTHKK